jgi:hypothetical protein
MSQNPEQQLLCRAWWKVVMSRGIIPQSQGDYLASRESPGESRDEEEGKTDSC